MSACRCSLVSRRCKSFAVWATGSRGGGALPPFRPGSDNRLRRSVLQEWRAYHRQPWVHHTELRDIINRHVQRTIEPIDRHDG